MNLVSSLRLLCCLAVLSAITPSRTYGQYWSGLDAYASLGISAHASSSAPVTWPLISGPRSAGIASTAVLSSSPSFDIAKFERRAKQLPDGFTGFTVILRSTEFALPTSDPVFRHFGGIVFDRNDTGGFDYMICLPFEKEASAQSFAETMVRNRYPEARVIRYEKGVAKPASHREKAVQQPKKAKKSEPASEFLKPEAIMDEIIPVTSRWQEGESLA